jgi:exosome complex component CSL4
MFDRLKVIRFSTLDTEDQASLSQPSIQVEIYKSFRPGDIVRAVVISLGTSRSYFLSTARNDLGVIFARSVAGVTMIPLSWECMICPKTKTKEFRKVCKLTED